MSASKIVSKLPIDQLPQCFELVFFFNKQQCFELSKACPAPFFYKKKNASARYISIDISNLNLSKTKITPKYGCLRVYTLLISKIINSCIFLKDKKGNLNSISLKRIYFNLYSIQIY